MRILITNDDGVGAPGIELLNKIARQIGETTVVAPDCQQSGISHQLSFERPLKLNPVSDGIYSVNGTPADCVRLAIAAFDKKFDWVLSGINDGANLGCDICYSGTVAAAREACLHGLPAIAISQYRRDYSAGFDWQGQYDAIQKVLASYLADHPKPGHWININMPDVGPGMDTEIIECDVDTHPLPPAYRESDGLWHWRFKYQDRPRDAGKDTDVCLTGNVAVSIRRAL